MMSKLSNILDRLPIELFLIALVAVSYWRVQGLWYVFDDVMYIASNEHISHGLNLPDIQWALTAKYAANWHPLTWISYMVDTQLRGMDPRQFHQTNLLIHIASMLLLFLLLNKMTKSVWKSAFVAALFGVHPLHVESVAWVSERKDVLSTFFWFATFWAYIRYTERRSIKSYLLVLSSFILGLMSKPMLVTLPFTLLLLDYWPLGRFKGAERDQGVEGSRGRGIEESRDRDAERSTLNSQCSTPETWNPEPGTRNQLGLGKLVLEKIPLFILTAASCVVTYLVQQAGGAFGQASSHPLHIRLMNVLYSYVMYIWKMVYPLKLAVFYPHPGTHLPIWQAVGAGALLAITTFLAFKAGRKRPYILFGWLWYVITLIPVIGIVQVGDQGMADRYTYVPLTGLFIIIAWGIPDLLDWIRHRPVGAEQRPFSPGLSAAAIVLIFGLAVLTRIQVRSWMNNVTLFQHATNVVENNYEAYLNFGAALDAIGDPKSALEQYSKAVAIRPTEANIHYNIAGSLAALGRDGEAIAEYEQTIKLDPEYAPAHSNMAVILGRQGKIDEAFAHLDKALTIAPDYADARNNLGNLLDSLGRTEEALAQYEEAIAAAPNLADAYYNKAVALLKMGELPGAIAAYREAIRCKPYYTEAHKNLATALYQVGEYEEAWKEVHLTLKYKGTPHPGFLKALSEAMPDPSGQ